MESRKEYVYLCGTKNSLVSNPQGLTQHRELENARKSLQTIKGMLIIPKFIGVYQGKGFSFKGSESAKVLSQIASETMRSAMMGELAKEMAKIDGKQEEILQPFMISVLYDPAQMDITLVNYLFQDPLQRLGKHPVERAPDFREKDTALIDLVRGNVREIVLDERKYKEQIRLLRINLELMEQQRRKYGLTLEERSFLDNSMQIWGPQANPMIQREAIAALREAYKQKEDEE